VIAGLVYLPARRAHALATNLACRQTHHSWTHGATRLARPQPPSPRLWLLELKETHGRTPVLDYSALARIHAGNITIVPIVPASVARLSSLTAAHSTSTPSPSLDMAKRATRPSPARSQWSSVRFGPGLSDTVRKPGSGRLSPRTWFSVRARPAASLNGSDRPV
jgi:hypothetical protein